MGRAGADRPEAVKRSLDGAWCSSRLFGEAGFGWGRGRRRGLLLLSGEEKVQGAAWVS